MTDPPRPPPEPPVVVVQVLGSLRIPLALYGVTRELLHAQPRDKFTRFDSVADAESAIARAVRLSKFGAKREDYDILSARAWLDHVEARAAVPRRQKKPPREEES